MKNGRKNPFRNQGKKSTSGQTPRESQLSGQQLPEQAPVGAQIPESARAEQSAGSAPATVEILLESAVAQHSAGQLAEAESLYCQILQRSPEHPMALRLLGVIACQKGNGAVALELLDRAIQINPADAEAYYLRGSALHLLHQYEAAVESFDRALALKPDYAEAYCNRGVILCALRQYAAAVKNYDNAIRLKPDFVDTYFNRGNALQAMEQHLAAIESYDRVLQLNPRHAEACNNRGSALLALEQYQAAIQCYEMAIALKPDYADAHSNRNTALTALEWHIRLCPGYESRKAAEVFESALKEVARIAQIQDKAAMKAALDTLPLEMRSHPVLCNFRNAQFIKTETSGKDLVFYCNPTIEIWNPQTAQTKGVGGSEEAVIWLSRLLHERGWNVTVYCSCGTEETNYEGVLWRPNWMWNCRDRQNVTVLWRHPQILRNEIYSDQVMVDLHDVIGEEEFTAERLDRIFVKSKFHRSLLANIPDEQFVILANGIDAKQFEGTSERDPMLLINTSSADRSLEAFVDCFEEIKKQVPNAKAQWAYGWKVWDGFYSSDAQRMEWKAKMQGRMRELGIVELGRISHDEIAKLYRKTNVFAYPSEFAEIDCISLSKAMAAGAIPVTTDFAAMGDKAGHGGIFIHSQKTKDDWIQPDQFHFEITDPGQRAQFVQAVVKLLLNPPSEQEREPMRGWARTTFDWNRVADTWDEALASCGNKFEGGKA